jgi:hypothetical protein
MIRQDANGNCFKRPTLSYSSVSAPQAVNLLNQQIARTVVKDDREEEDTALDLRATIVRHGL